MVRLHQKTKPALNTAFLFVLPALFAITAFLVILSQTMQYYSIANRMTQNYETRTASVYLTEKFRQYDISKAVSVTEFGGIPAISFTQENNSQTLLYVYDGYLREITFSNGSLIYLEDGKKIAKLEQLIIKKCTDTLYCFTLTDSTGITMPVYVSLNAH